MLANALNRFERFRKVVSGVDKDDFDRWVDLGGKIDQDRVGH
ncbi:unannotated protein [freshwater metagenome]|uniref:Unannotated protein n=1 Tax=freshwater metagenome TaxID=449393 RepID=A0A6J7N684_9ZZZZ